MDWVVTTLLILLSFMVLAGLSGAEILFPLVADVSLFLVVSTLAFENVDHRLWLWLRHLSIPPNRIVQ